MKILSNGIAVLEPERDALLSRWVERDNALSAYDSRIADLCRLLRLGDVVVDAGACLGTHAVAYAEAVGVTGRVIAIEPNPIVLPCLRHNAAPHPQIEVWPVALAATAGPIGLVTSDHNAGGSAIDWIDRRTSVFGVPLDAAHLDRLDYLKIDVEGYEAYVLEGAEDTIRHCQPIIVLEVNGRSKQYGGPDARDLLSSWGYLLEQLPMERPTEEPDRRDPTVYDIIARKPR